MDDFHTLKRKDLQALCKKHNIPANLSNLVMADKLTELLKVKEIPVGEIESDQVRKRSRAVDLVSGNESSSPSGIEFGEKVLTEVDLRGMKRRELQEVCKKWKIPANLKNEDMVNRLVELFKEKEMSSSIEVVVDKDEDVKEDEEIDDVVASKKVKKVRFSPEHEVIEFTRQRQVGRCRRRSSVVSRNSTLSEDKVNGVELCGENVGRIGRKGKEGALDVKDIAEENRVGESQVSLKRSSRRGKAVYNSDLEAGCSQVDAKDCGAKVESGANLEKVGQTQERVTKEEPRRTRRNSVFPLKEQNETAEESVVDEPQALLRRSSRGVNTTTSCEELVKESSKDFGDQAGEEVKEGDSNKCIELNLNLVDVVNEVKCVPDHENHIHDAVEPVCMEYSISPLEHDPFKKLEISSETGTEILHKELVKSDDDAIVDDRHKSTDQADDISKVDTDVPDNSTRRIKSVTVCMEDNISPLEHDPVKESEISSEERNENTAQRIRYKSDDDAIVDDRHKETDQAHDISEVDADVPDEQIYSTELKTASGLDLLPSTDEYRLDEETFPDKVVKPDSAEATDTFDLAIRGYSELGFYAEYASPGDSNEEVAVHEIPIRAANTDNQVSNSTSVAGKEENEFQLFATPKQYVASGMLDDAPADSEIKVEEDKITAMLGDTPADSEFILEDLSCKEAFGSMEDDRVLESKLGDTAGSGQGSDCGKVVDASSFLGPANQVSNTAFVAGTEENEFQMLFATPIKPVASGMLDDTPADSEIILEDQSFKEAYCSTEQDTVRVTECKLDGTGRGQGGVYENVVDEISGLPSANELSISASVTVTEENALQLLFATPAKIEASSMLDDTPTDSEITLEDLSCKQAFCSLEDDIVRVTGNKLDDISGGQGIYCERVVESSVFSSANEGSNSAYVAGKEENEYKLLFATPIKSAPGMLDDTPADSEIISEDLSCKEALCSMEEDTVRFIESTLDDIGRGQGDDYVKVIDENMGLASANEGSNSASVAGNEGDSNSVSAQSPAELKDTCVINETSVGSGSTFKDVVSDYKGFCTSSGDSIVPQNESVIIDGGLGTEFGTVAVHEISCLTRSNQELSNEPSVEEREEEENELLLLSATAGEEVKEGDSNKCIELNLNLVDVVNEVKCVPDHENHIHDAVEPVCMEYSISPLEHDPFKESEISSEERNENTAQKIRYKSDDDAIVDDMNKATDQADYISKVDTDVPDEQIDCTELETASGLGQLPSRDEYRADEETFPDKVLKPNSAEATDGLYLEDHSSADTFELANRSDGETGSYAEYAFPRDSNEEVALHEIPICTASAGVVGCLKHDHTGASEEKMEVDHERYCTEAADNSTGRIKSVAVCMEDNISPLEHDPVKESEISSEERNENTAQRIRYKSDEDAIVDDRHKETEVDADVPDEQIDSTELKTASGLELLPSTDEYRLDEETFPNKVVKPDSAEATDTFDLAIRGYSEIGFYAEYASPGDSNEEVAVHEIPICAANTDNQVSNSTSVPGKEENEFQLFATPKQYVASGMLDDAPADSEIKVEEDKITAMLGDTPADSEFILEDLSCKEAFGSMEDDRVLESKLGDTAGSGQGSDCGKVVDASSFLGPANQVSNTAFVAGTEENEFQMLFATPIKPVASGMLDDTPADSEIILEDQSFKEAYCSTEQDTVRVTECKLDGTGRGQGGVYENVVDEISGLPSANELSISASVTVTEENALQLLFATPAKIEASSMLDDTPTDSEITLEDLSCKQAFCSLEDDIVRVTGNKLDDISGGQGIYCERVVESSVFSSANEGSNSAYVAGKEENEYKLLFATPIKSAPGMLDDTPADSEIISEDLSCKEALCSMEEDTVRFIESTLDDIGRGQGDDYVKVIDENLGLASANEGSNSASVAGKEGDSNSVSAQSPAELKDTRVINETSVGSGSTFKDVVSCYKGFCTSGDSIVPQNESVIIDGGLGTEFGTVAVHEISCLTLSNQELSNEPSVEEREEEENELLLLSANAVNLEASCTLDETPAGSGSVLQDLSCKESYYSMADIHDPGCAADVLNVWQETYDSQNKQNRPGTPRKHLMISGDMKENDLIKKRSQACDLTTKRLEKRRRTLQDL